LDRASGLPTPTVVRIVVIVAPPFVVVVVRPAPTGIAGGFLRFGGGGGGADLRCCCCPVCACACCTWKIGDEGDGNGDGRLEALRLVGTTYDVGGERLLELD
jgi:hypothetical protein